MIDDSAINLAIEAMEAQIKILQVDADLVDIWSQPQPNELIVQDFRTPRRTLASEKRAQLRLAIMALERMRPRQRMMELEAA